MTLRVLKTLSPNDMGDTNSHQAGIHVPKALAEFFPALEESTLNPRATLRLVNDNDDVGICSYIHYNNKLVDAGTRDEYRITRIRPFLVECGAQSGDTVELTRLGVNRYRVRVLPSRTLEDSDTLIVDLARGWKTVRR